MNERLYKILRNNSDLCEIVKRLKILNREMDSGQITEIIKQMDLPLSKHLFLMANFHELVKFNFEDEVKGGLKWIGI